MDDMRRIFSWIPADWERKTVVCKPPFLGATLARYEQLPVSRRDPRVRDFDSSMENCRAHRQPRIRVAFRHPVDRLGTRAEKRDPFRFLGMQRARQPADAQLFCDLPARFRGRAEHGHAVADLSAEPLFPLHAPRPPAPGKRASTTAVSSA